jgi:hypothetical protein
MKTALLAPLLALLVLTAGTLTLAGCGEDDVGIPCQKQGSSEPVDPTQPSDQAPQITTNALDCRSRLCLSIGDTRDPQVRPLCTKLCESDSDCPDSGEACPQNEKFVCTVTVATTALACCKMCVCKYFLGGKDPNSGSTAASCARITPNCPQL